MLLPFLFSIYLVGGIFKIKERKNENDVRLFAVCKNEEFPKFDSMFPAGFEPGTSRS